MNNYIRNVLSTVPEFQAQQEEIVRAYHMAADNLLTINTVYCPSETYNKSGMLDEELGLMIRAGGGYPTPWTRDAAVNTMNAACFLEPEVAKNTLWAVCERVDGKLCFQMDNQSWDKIIWATGAWKYYLATGDKKFMADAFETIRNSILILEKTQYNAECGLFTGGSFFNDGITGYPKELHGEGLDSSFVGDHPATSHIMAFSTNCLYYHGYLILSRMADILGKEEDKEVYGKKAEVLKETLNRLFWSRERGTYAYLLYPDLTADWSQEGCGISFALLFGVCEEEQAVSILEHCHRSAKGIVSIWPPFEGLSSVEKPIRHNNLIWPVVNGFFICAAAKYGSEKIVADELENLARLALNNDGFWEIYNPETGEPDGGWQSGRHWDSVENQTWSATAYLSGIVFGVFGITLEEEKITFHPCLPEQFGPMVLKGIRFRDVELDISLSGKGSHISSIYINGREENHISFHTPGHYNVEICVTDK